MWTRFRRPLFAIACTLCAACLTSTNIAFAASEAQLPGIGHGTTGHLVGATSVSSKANVSDEGLAKQAKSACVMDFSTGKVLFEKDAHEKLPMASITKIMTMLLIMEAVDNGKLKWTDKIKTSEYAASMGGSQIFLEPGETMTAYDMLKGIAVASGNDACVAMAEHLYGSEEAFVRRMNERAKELGMDDTHFMNSNGLPIQNHYSSAHDIALMSRALLQHEDITKWTSVYSDYLRKDSARPLWLVNSNKLVRFYDGVDGLKTGFTSEAKYCLSATAKKEGFRVIAVVMGEPKPATRNAEVTGLLNWSFSQYSSRVLYKAGQIIDNARVLHGVAKTVPVKTLDTVGFVEEKGKKADYVTKIEMFKLQAPVQKNQRIGTLRVFSHDECVAEIPLLAANAVNKAGLFQSIGQTFRDMVTFGEHR